MRYGRNFGLGKKVNLIPDRPVDEDSDTDIPVALNFKDVEEERIKTEKTIKSAILASKKKSKGKSKTNEKPMKSVTFSLPSESDDKVLKLSDDEKEDDDDMNFDDLVKTPKVKKAKKSVLGGDVANEFDLADTFDFRKYLPKGILNEYGDEIDVDSDSDEELANAFIEGQYQEDSDDDEEEPKVKRSKKEEKKKTQEASSIHSKPLQSGSERKRRRRGGRRFRKKYSTAPRIVILSRQNTASMIRRRTEAFIKERLFGASPKIRGPRRYSGEEEIARVRLQFRARKM